MKNLLITSIALIASLAAFATKPVTISSPDGKLTASIESGDSLVYSISRDGKTVMQPSTLGLTLSDGTKIGTGKTKVVSRKKVDSKLQTPFYRHSEIPEKYNELTLQLSKDWDVVFRAYNDGIAYRFVTRSKKPLEIENETVRLRFPENSTVWAPYTNVPEGSNFERQFRNSFENYYTVTQLDSLNPQKLIFLPMALEPSEDVKVLITESALENYPGMYLNNATSDGTLTGVFAPKPKERYQGGHNNLQLFVAQRENHIASVDGPRSFPWRIVVVGPDDVTLAATDLSYLLGEPSRLDDISWIKPGKVAWEWWNAWNLRGVDFESGINNDTYKAYIDFAAKNGIEYVILDEGWAVNKKADLLDVVPEINIPELVEYADSKGVGIILWAGYYAFERDMENVIKHYADMGVKGFKVDFMDHDDQLITDFYYKAAESAAKNKVMLDFHGTSKPAGLNRTWPNVINFEGVNGLEQLKWAPTTADQVTYDVQIPFIRQAAGPMDYTQGAMRNATKADYRPVYDDPMSQGTRGRQLALYLIFDSPLNMLCDTPSNYDDEPESRDFIASVPTVWDETRIIDGKIGEYIVTARRKGNTWYIGGITDWTPRDIELDMSFIKPGKQKVSLISDGVNAHRNARDYKKMETQTTEEGKLTIHLAPGGGFVLSTLD